jgi:hypothetical protein
MTDDELQQHWDARPRTAERIEVCFFFDWCPDAVVRATGEHLEAMLWLYWQFRDSEDEALSIGVRNAQAKTNAR